jgi:hypothetical protein
MFLLGLHGSRHRLRRFLYGSDRGGRGGHGRWRRHGLGGRLVLFGGRFRQRVGYTIESAQPDRHVFVD